MGLLDDIRPFFFGDAAPPGDVPRGTSSRRRNHRREKHPGQTTFNTPYSAGDRTQHADWEPQPYSANDAIRSSLTLMRSRARDLARSNDYARRFLGLARNGIVGPTGIRVAAMSKLRGDRFDETSNTKIEKAFTNWGRMGSCTVDRRLSWIDLLDLAVTEFLTAGEVFIRQVPGFEGNDFRFALEILDADDVPHSLTEDEVVMGVELDSWGAAVSYRVLDDPQPFALRSDTRPIAASEILHLFISERAHQVRGVPYFASGISRMRMLKAIEDAYTIGVRIAASKMGFLQSETGDTSAYDEEDSGQRTMRIKAGEIEQIGIDEQFIPFDPGYPPTGLDSFRKEIIRGLASGLNVSYPSLGSDLEGVNYSSIRWGGLEERDVLRRLQRFFIEHLCDPIFDAWLPFAITSGQLDLDIDRIDRYREVRWQPRGFQWVDPDKEAKGKAQQLALGATTHTAIAAEQGTDFHENIAQIAREKELAKELGVNLDAQQPAAPRRAERDEEPDENADDN